MSYRQGEVLGRVERRRRFSLEQKVSVLAEAAFRRAPALHCAFPEVSCWSASKYSQLIKPRVSGAGLS
jgi:hypothetical protein